MNDDVDPYVVVERTDAGIRVRGVPAARVDQPWPADPSCSDVFAEWSWDGDALTVRNDSWGFQPLFYSAAPDRIGVSTSIPALLRAGIPADLDDEALAVFLRLSHFLAADTPFRAIRALPARTRLTWRAGRGADLRTDPWPRTDARLSRAGAVDGYVTLFRRAIERRLPIAGQRVVVPLSGGQDSRHILFELVHAGRRPAEAVTVHHYPPVSDDDATVAAEVAAAAGVPHRVLPLDTRRVAVERRKNLLTSLCADRHAQMLPLADYLRGRADVILDGLGGDILSGSRLEGASQELALLAAGRCDDLAGRLLRAHVDEAALLALLRPGARLRFAFDAARARVASELARHLDAPHPWGAYRVQNRIARSVALLPLALLARATRVMTPYLDRDLTAFLSALPTSELADGQLHGEAIARAFPQHAHIRYERRKDVSTAAGGYYRRLAFDLTREALRLPISPLVRRAFLLSRLIRPAVTGTAPWFQERRVVYLMQLEELTDGVRTSASPPVA